MARKRQSTGEPRRIKVREADVSILAAPPSKLRSTITIKGRLDEPVLRRTKANISVFATNSESDECGSAIGVGDDVWNLVAMLAADQFSSLLCVVASGRLAHVEVLIDSIRRGKGILRAIEFTTEAAR